MGTHCCTGRAEGINLALTTEQYFQEDISKAVSPHHSPEIKLRKHRKHSCKKSQRKEMKREAKLLETVNSVNVGPKLYDVSRNFVVMEYLEGEKIGDWIKNLNGKGSVKRLKLVIKSVLEDCYQLDQIGFDNGPRPTQKELQEEFEKLELDQYVSDISSSEKKKKYVETTIGTRSAQENPAHSCISVNGAGAPIKKINHDKSISRA